MDKIIVIINPSSEADLLNILTDLKDAEADQELPEGVQQIFGTAWLISVRKSLPFFASLVHSAFSRKIPVAVFAVDDGPLLIKDHYSNQS